MMGENKISETRILFLTCVEKNRETEGGDLS